MRDAVAPFPYCHARGGILCLAPDGPDKAANDGILFLICSIS